jgi:hypothetical protein
VFSIFKSLWFLIPILAFWAVEPGAGDPPNPVTDNGDGSEGEKKTYTQKELDGLFGERARQAKQTAINDLLKDLGVESPDAIKAALKAAAEAKAAQMTELEKAQAAATEAQKRAEDAEQARATAEAKAQERLLRADVLIEASKQGFNDPADAWLHLDKSLVEGKEDGSFKGIEKAVKAVLETKPYLGKKADKAIGTPRTQPNGTRPAPQDQPAPLGLKLRL